MSDSVFRPVTRGRRILQAFIKQAKSITVELSTSLPTARFTLIAVTTACVLSLIRSGIFTGLNDAGRHQFDEPIQHLVQYSWLTQALMVVTFAPWSASTAARIRSGGYLIDSTRPRRLHLLYLRSRFPQIVGLLIAVVIPVIAIGSFAGSWGPAVEWWSNWTLPSALRLVLSLMLVGVIAELLRMAQEGLSFWFADYRSMTQLVLFPLQLIGGLIVPVSLFPGILETVAPYTPYYSLVTAPYMVAIGNNPSWNIVDQLMWLFILYVVVNWMFGVGRRHG